MKNSLVRLAFFMMLISLVTSYRFKTRSHKVGHMLKRKGNVLWASRPQRFRNFANKPSEVSNVAPDKTENALHQGGNSEEIQTAPLEAGPTPGENENNPGENGENVTQIPTREVGKTTEEIHNTPEESHKTTTEESGNTTAEESHKTTTEESGNESGKTSQPVGKNKPAAPPIFTNRTSFEMFATGGKHRVGAGESKFYSILGGRWK